MFPKQTNRMLFFESVFSMVQKLIESLFDGYLSAGRAKRET